MPFKSFNIMCLIYFLIALPLVAQGQESLLPSNAPVKELVLLRASMEEVKKNLADINSELLMLRESAQFPARSQVAVFLTMDKLPQFQLESVEMRVGGSVVSSHNYGLHEKEAMQKGGSHRFYTGNLDPGLYTVKAVFTGTLSDAQKYSGSVSYNFKKTAKAKVFTLGISDLLQDGTPDMTIREDR